MFCLRIYYDIRSKVSEEGGNRIFKLYLEGWGGGIVGSLDKEKREVGVG